MNIYIAHSKDINYINELYEPLKKHNKSLNNLILPHQYETNNYNTREFYKTLDLVIAEVSKPATGLGIELGWAFDDKTPIYCISKKGIKVSSSLKAVTNNFFEYSNNDELLLIYDNILSNFKK